jgi:thiamine biosynthesis protein ThiS
MKIQLNGGEYYSDKKTLTVSSLVEHSGYNERQIAVSVNHKCVPKHSWENVTLQEGDSVRFLEISYGG